MEFLQSDNVEDLEELKQKLQENLLPVGIEMVVNRDRILLIWINEEDKCGPKISFCLKINANLNFELFVEDIPVPNEKYSHICSSNIITCGGNYFLSVRQFLEAEKKLHISTLVKHTKLNLKEIQSIFEPENSPWKEKKLENFRSC